MSIFGNKRDKGGRPPESRAGAVSFDPPSETVGPDGEVRTETVSADVGGDGAVAASVSDDVVTQAVPAAEPATSKSRFGKVRREPSAKPAKAVKPAKAKKSKDKGVPVDEVAIPLTVVIDFYQGVTKERDAEQIVRANIEKNFDSPNASYYYIQRWREGMAVEMQEGGGRAFLPEILAKLDEDEHAIVAVPMSNRVAQVRLDPETSSLETLLLLNNQHPPDGAFTAYPTRTMRPFDRRGSRLFVTGLAFLAVSVMAMLFAVGAFFLDKQAWALPYVQQTDVKILPAGQMPAIEAALAGGADCVYKLEFAGQWKVTPGYDSGGVCGTTRTGPAPAVTETQPGDVPTTPGGITSPSAAGAPGSAVTNVPPVGATPPVGAVPGALSPSTAPAGPPVASAGVPGAVPGR